MQINNFGFIYGSFGNFFVSVQMLNFILNDQSKIPILNKLFTQVVGPLFSSTLQSDQIIPRSQSQSLYSGMLRLLPGYRESEGMFDLDTIYDSPTMMAN